MIPPLMLQVHIVCNENLPKGDDSSLYLDATESRVEDLQMKWLSRPLTNFWSHAAVKYPLRFVVNYVWYRPADTQSLIEITAF